MKKASLVILMHFALSTGLMAQEPYQPPQVRLSKHEQCNNWARHYCRNGNHEDWVNQKLLDWKRQGRSITTSLIKKVAQQYTS
ncbi:MAG: hypothetical protein GY786_23435 [Proteobacteria bacterium]|nr:hypothetical protein [Pseudomonadota bacterium]